MSFALTERQLLDGTKTVTRRCAWEGLRVGERLRAVRKSMGLRKGESQHALAIIEVVSIRRERLDAIEPEDVEREGFAGWSVDEFVSMFVAKMGCHPADTITRIEFRVIQLLAPGQPRQLALALDPCASSREKPDMAPKRAQAPHTGPDQAGGPTTPPAPPGPPTRPTRPPGSR